MIFFKVWNLFFLRTFFFPDSFVFNDNGLSGVRWVVFMNFS